MNGIILQHWSGDLTELCSLSSANIAAYARAVGADYQLLRGSPFRDNLSSPCQKLHMLDASFDGYDWVVMLDADIFSVRGLTESVFTDVQGTGLFSDYTALVFAKCRLRHPGLCDVRYAYWGGAIYRLSRDIRCRLRANLDAVDLGRFSPDGAFRDEGIMHRLAVLARVPPDALPERWCQSSYLPEPHKAAFIHMRATDAPPPRSSKSSKMDNYRRLKALRVLV